MELKDFVSETLFEIQLGVQLAIQRTKKENTNGVINPVWGHHSNTDDSHIKEVRFDIAVTINDKTSDKLGAGIKVMGINVGGDALDSKESSHVSRIQFSIPIIPPVTVVEPER